jgi:hypothetical protein
MNTPNIIASIDDALSDLNTFELSYPKSIAAVSDAKTVLNLLKKKITINAEDINVRILRAMQDIGMSAYKDFENSAVEVSILKVTGHLYRELPIYRTLEPLRGEFGKGFPI